MTWSTQEKQPDKEPLDKPTNISNNDSAEVPKENVNVNWKKIILRLILALPASFVAGIIIRFLFYISVPNADKEWAYMQAILRVSDYGAMVSILVIILPRFKRTASIISGIGIVYLSASLLSYPIIHHKDFSTILRESIIEVPPLIFGVYCIISCLIAKIRRREDGIDQFDKYNPFPLFG